jgi:hypothetical protein
VNEANCLNSQHRHIPTLRQLQRYIEGYRASGFVQWTKCGLGHQ